MSDTPKETKKPDPEEMINISRKDFEAELYKAQEHGSEIQYNVLCNFLFCICEFFAETFRPQNAPMEKFLGFSLHVLQDEYKKKYCPKVEDEKEVPDPTDKEAS